MHRHEGVHAEQDGCDLDCDRRENEQSDRRREAFVSSGVHSGLYLSGTETGPGRRRYTAKKSRSSGTR